MSRRVINRNGTARAAVVGASSGDGSRMREALAESGVPGSRVDLYAQVGSEALISEYAGEARLIQEPDLAEIAGHDVIFLCEAGEIADRVVAAARPESVLIDVAGSLNGGRLPLVHADINPDAAVEHQGFIRVPHPIAALLVELLTPVERSLGIEELTAFVIRPAADFGEAGVEELREQTVRLLNFGSVPVETFGRQLAFNLLPQNHVPDGAGDLERRIAHEFADLLGWNDQRMALRLVMAPVFYGHSLQLRLRTRSPVGLDDIRAVLDESPIFDTAEGTRPSTPLEVSAEKVTSYSGLTEDGLGGFWLWIVAGDTTARAATHAVRLAAMVTDL
jgi:aspartate-semialdehyde dehydrogenase